MAKLPTIEQMKFRKYPPLRSGPPILWPTKRYFHRNEGSTDYATIPEVTLAGDFEISCLVSKTTNTASILSSFTDSDNKFNMFIDSSGRLQYSSKVAGVSTDKLTVATISDNTLTLLKFARVGTALVISIGEVSEAFTVPVDDIVIDTLYQQNGSLFLSGILANLKIYDAGTLVRDYPLNDNSDTIRDKANGQNGTIINGNASDWGLFDRQTDGDWLGQELVVQPINLITDWVGVGGGLIQTASTWNTSATGGVRIASPSWVGGVSVRINAEVYANSSVISVKDSATGQGADPTIATISANTQMNVEVDYVTINGGVYFRSTGETFDNELFSLSVKEVLKSA